MVGHLVPVVMVQLQSLWVCECEWRTSGWQSSASPPTGAASPGLSTASWHCPLCHTHSPSGCGGGVNGKTLRPMCQCRPSSHNSLLTQSFRPSDSLSLLFSLAAERAAQRPTEWSWRLAGAAHQLVCPPASVGVERDGRERGLITIL